MRTACPLCGHRKHPVRQDEFIVCAGCGELLLSSELRLLANRFTAEAYNRRNQKEYGYR